MMSTQSKEIKAVHVADLDNILKRYGQLEDFAGGNIRCQTCSDKISDTNAGSMRRVGKKLVFACNKMPCYEQMIRDTQRRQTGA